jgi:hypothetical protein
VSRVISGPVAVAAGFSARASHFLVFAAQAAIAVSAAVGRRYSVALHVAVTVAGSMAAQVFTSSREIAVKFGIATTRWLTSSVTKRWKSSS